MGYGRIEVSNDSNYSGTEGLTCTTIPSYHNVFVKLLDVQEHHIQPHRSPTVLREGTKPQNLKTSLTRPKIAEESSDSSNAKVCRFGGTIAQIVLTWGGEFYVTLQFPNAESLTLLL